MNDIITQLKDKQDLYGIVSAEKHERFSGTEDRYTIYFYNKDIPIIGGQYIELRYSMFSQDGAISLYEIKALDPQTKQFDYNVIAYERFKNKKMYQLERIFKQVITIGKASGFKRKILVMWYSDRGFNRKMLLLYALLVLSLVVGLLFK